jgi:exonuclease III
MYHNSPHNKRGTCILIKSDLNHDVINEYRDSVGNILGLKININDVNFLIVSVYGPNHNDKSFFDRLGDILRINRDIPTIIGGDWNLTLSTDNKDSNIDIINMLSPPQYL